MAWFGLSPGNPGRGGSDFNLRSCQAMRCGVSGETSTTIVPATRSYGVRPRPRKTAAAKTPAPASATAYPRKLIGAGTETNGWPGTCQIAVWAVSYTHLRAHETRHDLVCRLLL